MFAEEKIVALESELKEKRDHLMKVIDRSQELTDVIYLNLERRNGLCIRCLTRPMLALVLSYLGGPKSAASLVCKYWYVCARDSVRFDSHGRAPTIADAPRAKVVEEEEGEEEEGEEEGEEEEQ